MDSSHSLPSPADADAALRYVSAVRTRVRRALLLPSYAVPLGLGMVIAAHGLLVALVTPGEAVSIAWIGGLLAARPLLRWRDRRERSGRLHATDRLLVACVGAGAAAAVAAMAVGASAMISCIAGATAVRALLAAAPLAGVAALATGLVANAVLLGGVAPAMVELVTGTVLIVAGLAWRGVANTR
jgi:hypothetical protein